MLDGPSLARTLAELKGEGRQAAIDCFVHRSVALRHFLRPEPPAPLFAALPGKLGTRFVPPGEPISALYVAFEVETAHREGNQAFYQILGDPGLDLATAPPPEEVVLIGIQVRLLSLLDIRSDEVASRLETTGGELVSPWKTIPNAPTQRLGLAVHGGGDYEGLIYPSAQHTGGSCLVIFPDRLMPGSHVQFRSRTAGVPDARLPAGPAGPMAS
jgi:RES domain-containing protein